MIRCYIKPFISAGTYASEWIDVSENTDLKKLSSLKQQLDNNEYDVGIFGFNSLSITLENETGRYSDIDVIQSIFKYKRSNSLFKITWRQHPYATQCGTAICGESSLNDEIELFSGLINDESASSNIADHKLKLKVLGKESILSQGIVPYSSISVGDTFSEIMYTILNQAFITKILTVSASNISVSVDLEVDFIENLENATVKEALNDLLIGANAVLYVKDNTVYIETRTIHDDPAYTFYGQASIKGIENTQNISNIKSGVNNTFNFWSWTDTNSASVDSVSAAKNGYRKKEFSFDSITDSAKRQTILNELRDEFSSPKQEFTLTSTMDYKTIDLFILDKVSVDYPTVLFPADDNPLPIWGAVTWGDFKWPSGEWGLTIDPATEFKIMSRNLDIKNSLITFKLKEA